MRGMGVNKITPSPVTSLTAQVPLRERVDPQIRQAAEGFESMFLQEMMKAMRKTIPESELDFDGPAAKVYQSMLDSEYSEQAAKTGGVGLADLIIAYWQGQGYTGNGPQGAPPSRTGGTNEGK